MIDVRSGDTTRVQLVVEPDRDPPAAGDWSISGRVVLPDGTPPPERVYVRARPESQPWSHEGNWTEQNDTSRFKIEGLPEGRFLLLADYAGMGEESDPVPVEAGAEDVLLVIPEPRRLLVEVRAAASDEPMRGAEILIRDVETNVGWSAIPTDEDGRRSLFIRDGVFDVVVFARGFAPRTEQLTFSGERKRELRLALEPGRRIEGRVVDENGQPYRAEVVLLGPETIHGRDSLLFTRVATGPDGSFVFDSAPHVGGFLGVLRTPTRDEVFESSVTEIQDGMTLVVRED